MNLESIFSGFTFLAGENLRLYRGIIDNPGMKGQYAEDFWKELLKSYLPIKYGVDSGKVIDSTGLTSNQIDIIIYNKNVFPYVLKAKGILYIPIESVVGVFEVKQDINRKITYASKKIESVRILKSSFLYKSGREIEYFNGSPWPILGGVLTTDASLSKESLEGQLKKLQGARTIDIGCCANNFSFYVKYNSKDCLPFNYKLRNNADVQFYNSGTEVMVFVYHLIQILQRNTKDSDDYLIDIDAYLRAANAELAKTPVSFPLF